MCEGFNLQVIYKVSEGRFSLEAVFGIALLIRAVLGGGGSYLGD